MSKKSVKDMLAAVATRMTEYELSNLIVGNKGEVVVLSDEQKMDMGICPGCGCEGGCDCGYKCC